MISNTGIWSEDEKIFHVDSIDLLNSLKEHLNNQKPVYDFGCGTGFYLKELSKCGFNGKLIGFEGTSVPKAENVIFEVTDLSSPMENILDPGQILSFEVGEHIPKEFEQSFIDNITRFCDSRLIISWAVPGQIGLGHVNCQSNDYIINEINKRGFIYNISISNDIRNRAHNTTPWFKDTIMVFDKK